MRRVLSMALLPLVFMGLVMVFYIQRDPVSRSNAHKRVSWNSINNLYVYYVLKQADGFVLARAPKGSDGQPVGVPQPLTHFTDGFGLTESDSILSMQLSPDRRYLAIDGTRDHGEQVWVYDTWMGTLSLTPPNVIGNFLNWLPGSSSHTFLYRPVFPMNSLASGDGHGWNPGLWEVNAATGKHKNIDIGVPSAFLIDAAPAPDGTRIVYSTTPGLGMGSDTWLVNSDGGNRTHLFSTPGDTPPLAGVFAWSPNGRMIAYERLADSPTPFLPANLWIMDGHGRQQRYLAEADGGHGYTLAWSPDSERIAFVKRTNVGDHLADTNDQRLQCAIAISDVATLQSWVAASPAQTGMPINVNPSWSVDEKHIDFTAFYPINRVLGGSPHYWSTGAARPQSGSSAILITPAVTHVVATG
jgi:hypothetical protein